jgi:hypothetical protein
LLIGTLSRNGATISNYRAPSSLPLAEARIR